MQSLDVIKMFNRTIESLATSGSVQVYFDGIVGEFNKLNSPYTSHVMVDYRNSGLRIPRGEYLITNGNFSLYISEYDPNVPPEPVDGFVAEWVRVTVPAQHVMQVVRRLRRLGIHIEMPNEIVTVRITRPRLVGWVFGAPAFSLAGEKPGTLLQIDAQRVGTIGQFEVYRPRQTGWNIPVLPDDITVAGVIIGDGSGGFPRRQPWGYLVLNEGDGVFAVALGGVDLRDTRGNTFPAEYGDLLVYRDE